VVRIANGCKVVGGRVVDVRMPRRRLVRVQVVEYLRAFLMGWTGWSRLGGLLVISAAFGIFRQDLVVKIGGMATTQSARTPSCSYACTTTYGNAARTTA